MQQGDRLLAVVNGPAQEADHRLASLRRQRVGKDCPDDAADEVGLSLLLSPIIGFVLAGVLVYVFRLFV
jgi:hypothetical protein